MKKIDLRICITFALIMTCFFCSALAADLLTGEWKGSASVSGLPTTLSITVTFEENGIYTLSTFGLTAKGRYVTDGKTMTISVGELSGIFSGMLQSPKTIGNVQALVAVNGNDLSIILDTQGIKASMTAKRK